jgi:hypothetical protein
MPENALAAIRRLKVDTQRDIMKDVSGRMRVQVDATRHYLVQNGIDPHFADVLLSHYLDFSRELEEAANG